MKTAEYWIEKLEMVKHPEGGYFKEMHRSNEIVNHAALPTRYSGDRTFFTSIYFLLKGEEFSSFHRIQSDETWHFYQGTTLELVVLNDDKTVTSFLLGPELEQGECLQVTIPKNHWFGSRIVKKNSYALVGCTVAPGFDFDDFELAERTMLIEEFPKHENLIRELTFPKSK